MKVTRRQLRQIIRETIKKEPLFDPVIKSELDDAMLRSRETAIANEIQKKNPGEYSEEEARDHARKLIHYLYELEDKPTAEFLADSLDIDPAMLDMKYYQGDRKKFLGGQLAHAKSVAADQLRANLTDPNANFGNPQMGNPDLASDETRASKWWKENVLNKPAVLEDLEIIPYKADANYYRDGIVVASSHKDVIENLIKNMLAHRRVGDSASYIKMDDRDYSGGGQTRKLGAMNNINIYEYGTADPFQAYRLEGDGMNHTSNIKDMLHGGDPRSTWKIPPFSVNIGKKYFVIVNYDGNMTHSPLAYDSVAPYGSQDYDAPEGPFHGYQSKTAGAPIKRKYN